MEPNSNLILIGGVQQVDPKKIGDSSPEGRIPRKSNQGTYINPLTPSQSRIKKRLQSKQRLGGEGLPCHLGCQRASKKCQLDRLKNKNRELRVEGSGAVQNTTFFS